MVNGHTFRYFRAGFEIVRLAVIMYDRFPLSLCNVEGLLREGSIHACNETVRFWWKRSGPIFASEIRNWCVARMRSSCRRWHPDKVFVKINGERHYLWRSVYFNAWTLMNVRSALSETG